MGAQHDRYLEDVYRSFFVDTSALYVLMDGDDPNQAAAWTFWRGAADSVRSPITHARLREVSLIDTVSFEVMRRLGVDTAFACDSHCGRYGFTTFPVTPGPQPES